MDSTIDSDVTYVIKSTTLDVNPYQCDMNKIRKCLLGSKFVWEVEYQRASIYLFLKFHGGPWYISHTNLEAKQVHSDFSRRNMEKHQESSNIREKGASHLHSLNSAVQVQNSNYSRFSRVSESLSTISKRPKVPNIKNPSVPSILVYFAVCSYHLCYII